MDKKMNEVIDENNSLKCELEIVVDRFHKAEQEKELLKMQIAELEREKAFNLGQIEAYRFALKGGGKE